MKAVNVKVLTTQGDVRTVKATIVADTVPQTLPTTGEGIEGLNPSDVFAPLSALLVIANGNFSVYLANTAGVFIPI